MCRKHLRSDDVLSKAAVAAAAAAALGSTGICRGAGSLSVVQQQWMQAWMMLMGVMLKLPITVGVRVQLLSMTMRLTAAALRPLNRFPNPSQARPSRGTRCSSSRRRSCRCRRRRRPTGRRPCSRRRPGRRRRRSSSPRPGCRGTSRLSSTRGRRASSRSSSSSVLGRRIRTGCRHRRSRSSSSSRRL